MNYTEKELESIRSHGVVDRLVYLPSVNSTNDLALASPVEADDSNQVTVFLTDEQTAGRGRRENNWFSSQGALTFSLLINADRLALPRSIWPLVSLATGLATASAINGMLDGQDNRALVKWPNDVYIGERKVVGILVETRPDALDHIVLGIGVNVGNDFSSAPPEIREQATSLNEYGEFSRSQVLLSVLEHLTATLGVLKAEPLKMIAQLNQVSFLKNRKVEIDTGNTKLVGIAEQIGPDGCLIVETAKGPEKIVAGSVALL